MGADTDKQQRQQRTAARQARALTRAIDMVSEEFIENFSQTGIDDGPEKPVKLSPVRQALADREARETKEAEVKAAEPEFRGFAALMANANRKSTGAFARLLEAEPLPTTEAAPAASPYVKVRETVGKKRGLYTSCMQRPDAAQMEEWAAKAAQDKKAAQDIKAAPATIQTVQKKSAICSFEAQGNTCPISFAFAKIGQFCRKLFSRC